MRLPARRAEIETRIRRDPGAAELCEAYEAAWCAAEFWQKSDANMAHARAAEFMDIANAVEKDIIDVIT